MQLGPNPIPNSNPDVVSVSDQQFSLTYMLDTTGNLNVFHNRPVRAAMGSVIANGGVQLSNDESLIRAE